MPGTFLAYGDRKHKISRTKKHGEQRYSRAKRQQMLFHSNPSIKQKTALPEGGAVFENLTVSKN
jgi:hypothetical protein